MSSPAGPAAPTVSAPAPPPPAPPVAAPVATPPPAAPELPERAPGNLGDRVRASLAAPQPEPVAAPGAPPPAAPPAEPPPAEPVAAQPEAAVETPPEAPDITEVPDDVLGEAAADASAVPAEVMPDMDALADDPVVKEALEKVPQLKKAWNDHKKMGLLGKPWEVDEQGNVVGGIGLQSVEQARQMYVNSVAYEAMMADLHSDDPDRNRNWAAAMYGVNMGNGTPRPAEEVAAVNRILETMPDVLARVNPQGHALQSASYMKDAYRRLYQAAQSASSPDQANFYLNTGRNLEWLITGDTKESPVKTQEEIDREKNKTPEQLEVERQRLALDNEKKRIADEQAAQRKAIERKNLEQIWQRQNATAEWLAKSFLGYTRQPDGTMKPPPYMDGVDPQYQRFIIKEYLRESFLTLERNATVLNIALEKGRKLARTGHPEQIKQYLQREYVPLISPALEAHRQKYIGMVTGQKARQAKASIPSPERASQLATSAQNANPGGPSGAPVAQPVAIPERKPGSLREVLKARMSTVG